MKITYQPAGCLPFPTNVAVGYSAPLHPGPGDKSPPRKALACLLVAATALGALASIGGVGVLDRFVHPAFFLALLPALALGRLACEASLTAGRVLWDPPVGAPTSSLPSFAGHFWSRAVVNIT